MGEIIGTNQLVVNQPIGKKTFVQLVIWPTDTWDAAPSRELGKMLMFQAIEIELVLTIKHIGMFNKHMGLIAKKND